MSGSRMADAGYTRLFRELYPRLCRFLGTVLGDSRRAEELAQETLLRLYRSSLWRGPADDATNWVFRVGRNLALNERKHAATARRLTSLRVLDGGAAEPTPEQRLQQKQELAVVLKLVRELPENQRDALLLREQEGLTYEQIARVLNITLANVKVTIFRARKQVREGWRALHGGASRGAG